eukprot:scaffold9921_cov112-Isochrysis_galbana.AAC.9
MPPVHHSPIALPHPGTAECWEGNAHGTSCKAASTWGLMERSCAFGDAAVDSKLAHKLRRPEMPAQGSAWPAFAFTLDKAGVWRRSRP